MLRPCLVRRRRASPLDRLLSTRHPTTRRCHFIAKRVRNLVKVEPFKEDGEFSALVESPLCE